MENKTNLLKRGEVVAAYAFGSEKIDLSVERVNKELEINNNPLRVSKVRVVEGMWLNTDGTIPESRPEGMSIKTVVGIPVDD